MILLGAVLLAGCAPNSQSELEKNFTNKMKAGEALWTEAQEFVESDPHRAREILLNTRETFLQAALISPSNTTAAEKIAGVCTQLNDIEQAIGKQKQTPNQSKKLSSSDDENQPEDFDENSEWSESELPSDMSMPMSSGNFQTALQNKSLPTPNYTAEEILMEEAANMEERAKEQSTRAGSKVEKNW
jgi:hypothetical protein